MTLSFEVVPQPAQPEHTSGESSVAIIITTRDRADDLSSTLTRLIALGLSELPIYIVDDASKTPVSSLRLLSQFSNCHVFRNSECKGLIVNRNFLARAAKETVLISLDDDSCFEAVPDMQRLADSFSADATLCAVEFDNFEAPATRGTDVDHGAAIQMFTGYGHAIHRERFLAIGGYRDCYFHMCEERDFGRRAWKTGYRVRKYRHISILHRRSPVARLHDRNLFYLARNTILSNIGNFGLIGAIWLPFAAIAMLTIWPPARGRRRLAAAAVRDAIQQLVRESSLIAPMSLGQMLALRRLPIR